MIPAILSGKSVLIKDVTGSGKTLGLLAAVLSRRKIWESTENGPKVIVFAASNYLAAQMFEWTCRLRGSADNVKCILSIGDISLQEKELKEEKEKGKEPLILIGTPQRLLDLYDLQAFTGDSVQTIVLDEMDKLVEFEHEKDSIKVKYYKRVHRLPADSLIDEILKDVRGRSLEKDVPQEIDGIPPDEVFLSKDMVVHSRSKDREESETVQIIGCSASIDPCSREKLIEKKWTRDPIVLDISGDNRIVVKDVNHHCIILPSNGKVRDINLATYRKRKRPSKKQKKPSFDYSAISETVALIAKELQVEKAFVFGPSTMSISSLAESIDAFGVSAKTLWLNQLNQDSSFLNDLFAHQETRLVCLPESMSRGLDVVDCPFVFIIGKPQSADSFIHMAGRTGRFGKSGTVVSILLNEEEEPEMARYFHSLKIPVNQLFVKQD